jgi:alpha-ketoglutarate-dependent taurine dioxygenase
MDRVFEKLSREHARILAQTSSAKQSDAPPFLRFERGRPVFSFKDTHGAAIEWTYAGDESSATADDVNQAIAALLRALYVPSDVTGFHWQRNALGIFDNMRLFHGRTFAQRPTDGRAPRHLRRVRVMSRSYST